jgi:hypothetical protein
LEPADGAPVPTLVYDLSSRQMASLDLAEHSYALSSITQPVGLPLHLPGGCTEASPDCKLKGEEVVAGRRTRRFQSTHAPHDTVTSWVDLELGYPIREEADLFGHMTIEDIRVGALDPGLFLVPDGFHKMASE